MRILLLAALLGVAPVASASGSDPCSGKGTSLLVRTGVSELLLCESGATKRRFTVALGREGTGKSKQGDLKTPLGSYGLGEPRKSRQFGTFIPIAYPTPEQRKKGYSGQDVGIHGPKRGFAWAGRANAWFDWTAGCVAVATDAEIAEIAAFVRRAHVGRVVIE